MGSKPKKHGMVRKRKSSGTQVRAIMGKVVVHAPPPVPGNPQPEDPNPSNIAAESPLSSSTSMCYGCHGQCCALLAPEMTMYDVARIAGLEGKEIGSFLQFLEADDRDAMAFRAGGRMLKMVLRAQGGKCIYHNPSSRLKCSIQDSKPAVCLAYPMKFLLKNESGFMDNALCPAENLAKARTVIPQKTLIDARWEWERHLEIVSDWNSSSRGNEDASEFFAFAAREIEAEKTPLGSLLRRARRAFRKR